MSALLRTLVHAVTRREAKTPSTWVCTCGTVNGRHSNPFVCRSCGEAPEPD